MDYYITDYHVSGADAVALEDSIMLKGHLSTAGSKILQDFVSPLDATVITKLLDNGFVLSGKTAMNEFGIGGITADVPDETTGAVKAVADGLVPYALCNDVFGTYRRQAAENGLCYIHPTYGTVSRYGLIPLVCSMDQIGIVCNNLSDGFSLLSAIAGNDPKDGAMFPEESYAYEKTGKDITVGIPEAVVNQADEKTQRSIRDFAGNFRSVSISLDYFDVYKQVMYILSCAEISNNISRYDGIKFGYRTQNYKSLNDLYVNTRTEGFGLQTKLAAIMGSLALSQDQYVPCYEQAMKIRRLIKESPRFDAYDIIILPAAVSGTPYDNLSLFALAPLAGLPSVTFSHQGCGIQLIANVKNENALMF